MILMIDNYDSFTYNLYQYAGMINPDVQVVRNDKIDIAGIRQLNPSHIILSPGPGYPVDAGITIPVIRELGAEYPILGICLGHQAIGEAYGGTVIRAPEGPVHGKKSDVRLDISCTVFAGLPETLSVGRYHSLVVRSEDLPDALQVTASTENGVIMGVQHKTNQVYGIQFHPESLLTDNGLMMIKNFLAVRRT